MVRKSAYLALAVGTILSIATPAMSQTTPAFRVPMGAAPTSSTVEPTYAWLEQLGNCSTTCGTGTRSTSYQCQNVADYDYSGGGYGLPEPDASCTASAGPKPASTNASCTVYSGCGYDWVKPPVVQTPIPLDTNPIGRLGCGYVKSVFSPYCQRTGGGTNIVMSASDHSFCSSDRPDYDQVAAGDPDALGYDRNGSQVNACNTSDHDWRAAPWGSWTGGGNGNCDSAARRTREVSCYRRFDNTLQLDAKCSASTRPESSEVEARYSSCTYSYSYSDWSSWSSGCDTNATRTRTETCIRSNNGGQAVALSECTSRSVAGRQGTSETSAQYGSCTYAFQPGGWSAWSSGCDSGATRTRSVPCVRSNNGGQTVADTECTNRGQTKPATSETSAQYGSCSYSFATGAWGSYNSSCSNSATRTRSVTCTRSNNGGTPVADSECTSRGVAQPPSSETTGQYGGCSYAAVNPGGWSGWASGCSNSTTRTRQYQCQRSNDGGQIVANSECTSRGVSLIETQGGANYASCTYSWTAGSWSAPSSGCSNNAIITRSVSCRRDLDGATVADGYCNAGTRPSASQTSPTYSSCSYAAVNPGGWSGWASGCSTSTTRTRQYQCQRSNDGGQIVADGECTGRGVGLTETQSGANYASCTYSWAAGGWSAPSSTCSSSAVATRAVSCRRDVDGATVADSFCSAGTRPASSQAAPTYSSCSYAAVNPGGWSGWASGCSANTTRTRQYQCQRSNDGGQIVADSECTGRGVSLTETQSGTNYASCSYSWQAGGWGSFNSGCSATATRTRSVWCARDLDGATVADGNCNAGTRPGSSETTAQYGSCSYGRGAENSVSGWNSTCSANAQRTHYYNCNRSDGSVVASAECTNRGISVTSVETAAIYSGCTYSLQDAGVGACQSNNTAPHYWRCIRNQTGEQVDSATYCGRANPTYDACTYYSYELQDAGLGACQTNNQAPRYWRCIRRPDGAQVDSATYCGRANPTYESCSFQWTYRIEDAGAGACQTNNQRPHYWRCIRNEDGAQVDSATYCGRSNPTTESCQFPWTYRLEDAGVGACQTNDQAPHYWRCIRNEDGAQVDSATYCGRGNPTYDSCSYPWGYTPSYGGWSACTNGTQTRTMSSCTRSDGTVVSTSMCTGAGHASTQSQSCTVTPQYEYGDLCSGGNLLGQYESFRSSGATPYNPPAWEGGDRWVLDSCLTQVGRCMERADTDWSEYGTYETYRTIWSCYGNSSGVTPSGSSDSWTNYGGNSYESTRRTQ